MERASIINEEVPNSNLNVETLNEERSHARNAKEVAEKEDEFADHGDQRERVEEQNKIASLFDEQLEWSEQTEDGGSERRTVGDVERASMLIECNEADGDTPEGGPTRADDNDVIGTAKLVSDSVLLHPARPPEGSNHVEEALLEYPQTYMRGFGHRGEGMTTELAASSPSDVFQASNVNVIGSTVVASSWRKLIPTREKSGDASGPSSSDASPNSAEEILFINTVCQEPMKLNDSAIRRDPGPPDSSCDNSRMKYTRFETIPSSGASDLEKQYSSVGTTEEIDHSEGTRTTSGAFQGKEKAAFRELCLRNVLSDPITGAFMDDAMVAMCGHSFGSGSLQQIMETHSCLSCGASVPPNTLVPNFALRAAVLAYKHEDELLQLRSMKGTKRRREQFEHLEGSEARDKAGVAENIYSDSSRPKGVHFPFSVSDRVLIKQGNKRTPERFVGCEAVITSQCLNGWYLVRTLDTGESVRLQYRSLQKLGEMGLPFSSEAGHLVEQLADACCSPLPMGNLDSSPSCMKAASDYGLQSQSRTSQGDNAIVTSTYPSIAGGVLHADSFERESNAVLKQPVVAGGAGTSSNRNGGTHNYSPEILGVQVGRKTSVIMETTTKPPESLDEQALDARINLTGSTASAGDVLHAPELRAGLPDQDTGNESLRLCSRGTAIQSKSSACAGAFVQDSDPYCKVYTSGSLRRAGKGECMVTVIPEHTPLDNKCLKVPRNVGEGFEKIHCKSSTVAPSLGSKLGRDMKLKSANEILQIMRKDMLKLEKQIPGDFLLRSWRGHRVNWRKLVKSSHTVLEFGAQVRDLRYSLLLTTAGGMSDEEWEMRISLIIDSGDVEGLVSLWGRLYDDVYKWLGTRSKSVKGDDIQRKRSSVDDMQERSGDGDLNGVAMSLVHMTTNATLAAIDTMALSQQDPDTSIKALLASTMQLLQKQSCAELQAVRDALDREKRHIAAKLAYLDRSFMDLTGASEPSNLEAADPNQCTGMPGSPESGQGGTSTLFLNQVNAGSTPLVSRLSSGPEDNDTVLPRHDADGEATDMSDSD